MDASDQVDEVEAADEGDAGRSADRQQRVDRVELIATFVLAIATVLTAWGAFQATKWGGVQANSYAAAGAARVESSKVASRAGQLVIVDVGLYQQWVGAVAGEEEPLSDVVDGVYTPAQGTEAGYLYSVFPDRLRVAFDAWIALDPVGDPEAPRTPFEVTEEIEVDGELVEQSVYVVEGQAESEALEAEADALSAVARQSNQRSDNYVLLTVLFASALFFAGVGSKLNTLVAKYIALGLALTIVSVGLVLLATSPIEI